MNAYAKFSPSQKLSTASGAALNNATDRLGKCQGWTIALPTKGGHFRWRHGPQSEEVIREVVYSTERQCLATWSHRYEQRVPLIQVYGEWNIADLEKADRKVGTTPVLAAAEKTL